MKKNMNENIDPNDVVKRVLLMMKYDLSQTLTENKEKVEPITEDTGTAAVVGGGLGAATGYGLASYGLFPGAASTIPGLAGYAGTTGLGVAAETIGGALGIGLTGGAAVIGGAVGLAVIPLVYWYSRKDTGSADKVKSLFKMCSTNPNINKLPRKISDREVRDLADDIYDALNHSTLGFMGGTDEDKLYDTFRRISDGTSSDVCALYKRYTSTRGELYEDLDSDIDSPDEWEQIYRPIRNCVEDSLLELQKHNPCKTGEVLDIKTKTCVKLTLSDDEKLKRAKACGHNSWEEYKKSNWGCLKKGNKNQKKSSQFKVCTGTYSVGCKSQVIRKAQGCLGITADGLFGPETKGAVVAKLGRSSFTDADVNTICGTTTQTTQPVSTTPVNEPEEISTETTNINDFLKGL
jgi:hypothetical protein